MDYIEKLRDLIGSLNEEQARHVYYLVLGMLGGDTNG